jgi:ABC-type phosphate/phosphonate transport system substrate-binding protein
LKDYVIKCLACLSFLVGSLHWPVHAEMYHLIAGSSELGFIENDKQNVNLGFNSVFNELLSSVNVQCDFKSYENSEALVKAIKEKKVNGFFGSPIEFLYSESSLLSTPIASGIFAKQTKSKILIVVKKESKINDLTQLKGKKIGMQKWISSDVAGIFLETLLMENNLPLQSQFFSEIVIKDTSNMALVDLYFNKVDAILVNQVQFEVAAELNPQLLQQTKILVASEPYLIFVSALSKETPDSVVSVTKEKLLNIHKTAKGRNILRLMKLEGFQEVSVKELDNVRALMAKHKRLKAQRHAQ